MQGDMRNESSDLAAGNVFSRNYSNGVLFPVPGRLRKNIRGRITEMTRMQQAAAGDAGHCRITAGALTLEHEHILVVDDESQITRVLRTSLSSHGYDIRVANDGEAALEIMKDWSPDLVITDLAMPNMEGLELCRRLRAKTRCFLFEEFVDNLLARDPGAIAF